jgi:hypothetical protein
LLVENENVSLVYGIPPTPNTPAPPFFKQHWKLIAEAGGGGLGVLLLVVIIYVVVRRAKARKHEESNDPLLRTEK